MSRAVALVLALLAVAQAEVWLGWQLGGAGTPTGSAVLRSALVALPVLALLLRVRRPLVTVALVCGALWVQLTLVSPSISFVGGFVPLAVATYAAALYAGRGRWAALVVEYATLGVLAWRIPEERQQGELLFGVLVLTCVWLAGDLVRGRLDRADRAEARAAQALLVERGRIARELHDVIAHGVSVMGVQAGAARRLLDRSDVAGARDALLAVEDTARASVGELGRLLTVLRSESTDAPLEPQPGLARLPELVAQVRAAGLPVTLTCPPLSLSPGLDLTAYRVVQEALTNALKHAGGATSVSVTGGEELRIVVASTGRTGSGGSGHGLDGMRERVTLYGGSLVAGPDRSGFVVRAVLPT